MTFLIFNMYATGPDFFFFPNQYVFLVLYEYLGAHKEAKPPLENLYANNYKPQ